MDDSVPISAFRKIVSGRQSLQVFASCVVAIEASVWLLESVTDTSHHEMESNASVDGPMFSSHPSNCSSFTYSSVGLQVESGIFVCNAIDASAISSAAAGRCCIW